MHFFIEQTKIDLQPSAYGPVPAAENTQYRITSTFNLNANAKAFACQGGSILVLPSTDPLLVNVILKPDSGLQVPCPAVKYYIYRGLLKDSFITGANITPKAATNTDFVAGIWRQVEKYRAVKPLPDPLPSVMGYLPALSDTIHVEALFNNDPSLSLADRIALNRVVEGNWIGNFGTTAGFEIITENDLKSITLGYCKKTDHVLNIAGISASTDAQKLTLRMEKEKILHYIDPAAFWGMHYKVGMYVYAPGLPDNKKKISLDQVYFEVMKKYLTKNRVYLDIRSEKGYSYNFYTNYGDTSTHKNLRFKIPDDAAFRELEYGARWPIFMYHFGRFENANISKFIIQLRVDDNEKPLLFFEDPKLINGGPIESFIKPEKLLNGSAKDWTNEISLLFKNVQDSDIANQPTIPVEPDSPGQPTAGFRVYIGNHLRIQYFRFSGINSAHPMVFKSMVPADRAFGGVDLLPVNTGNSFLYANSNKRSNAARDDYSYVAETGIFYNSQLAVLYAKSLIKYTVSDSVLPWVRMGVPEKLLIDNPIFPTDIYFEKWKLINAAATQEIDAVRIAGFDERKLGYFTEDNFFLGLTLTELDTLRATVGFHPDHTRYLVFKSAPVPFDDREGLSYKAYSLEVTGYDANGSAITTNAPASPVVVYTLDEQLYFSIAFVQQSPLPVTLPDPGTIQDFANGRFELTRGGSYVSIQDKEFGHAMAIPTSILIRRKLFWPVPDSTGALPAGKTFPLVVIVHGNGHLLDSYNELAVHLAKNGFFVAVVDCLQKKGYKVTLADRPKLYFQIEDGTILYYQETDHNVYRKEDDLLWNSGASLAGNIVTMKDVSGMGVLGREHVIFQHLTNLQSHSLASHIQFNNIGLIGHSRGGEAVVKIAGAPDLIPPGCVIKSIISLAPTDMYDQADLMQNIPYFVLYGSRDGDVTGDRVVPIRNSGFSLYDRAKNHSEKSMAFVYGATHNGFITGNTTSELKALGGEFTRSFYDKKIILEDAPQQYMAKAYMNAFLRMTLRGQAIWKPLFTGELKPRSLGPANNKGIFLQYQAADGQRKSIDDFEPPSSSDWRSNLIGTVDGVLDSINEEFLSANHSNSPHQTRGLQIKWKSDNKLVFHLPPGHNNIAAYKYISFRIARGLRSTQSLEELRVELRDANKMVYAKTNSNLYPGFIIPAPDIRINDNFSKEALMTVRIPLGLFPDTAINRSDIKSIAFVFPKGSGELALDNVEFTN
jgi:dienelactone hydrolase